MKLATTFFLKLLWGRFMNFLNNTKIILFVYNSLALLSIHISFLPQVIVKLSMSFKIFVITKKALQFCRFVYPYRN